MPEKFQDLTLKSTLTTPRKFSSICGSFHDQLPTYLLYARAVIPFVVSLSNFRYGCNCTGRWSHRNI